ncbi:hypothetical protein D3C75_1348910 [compost metagenome]
MSVKKAVDYDEEWCAEAYMVTDYSKLTAADFVEVMKRYAVFKAVGLLESGDNSENEED